MYRSSMERITTALKMIRHVRERTNGFALPEELFRSLVKQCSIEGREVKRRRGHMTRLEFEKALFARLCTHDHVDGLLFLTILVLFSCIPLRMKLIVLLKACTFTSDSSSEMEKEDNEIFINVVQVELVATSIHRVVNRHVRCTNLERGGHIFTRKEIIHTMSTFCSSSFEHETSLCTFASLCSSSEEVRSWNVALSKCRMGRNEYELYPLRRIRHLQDTESLNLTFQGPSFLDASHYHAASWKARICEEIKWKHEIEQSAGYKQRENLKTIQDKIVNVQLRLEKYAFSPHGHEHMKTNRT